MTRSEVSRRARIVVGRELCMEPARVRDSSDFRADLRADSLDMVTLPRALEDEFSIILTDGEVEFCQTFGTAVDVITSKIENGGRA